MLNVDFLEKSLRIVLPPHYKYAFLIKINILATKRVFKVK